MVDSIAGNKSLGPLGNIGRTAKPGAANKTDAARNTDRVEFSSALQNATRAQEVSATQETSRAEKIQALKAQIENGTYRPDLDKVAASILPFILKDS